MGAICEGRVCLLHDEAAPLRENYATFQQFLIKRDKMSPPLICVHGG